MNCRSLFIFDIMHYKHLSRENMYKEQMISTIFANETKQKKIHCRFSSKYFACCECTHMYQVYNTQLAINDVWQHFKKMLACLWSDVHIHMARIILWITLKRHFYDAILQSYHMRWRFANRSPPSGITTISSFRNSVLYLPYQNSSTGILYWNGNAFTSLPIHT